MDERVTNAVRSRLFDRGPNRTAQGAFRILTVLQDREPSEQLLALALAYRTYAMKMKIPMYEAIEVAGRMTADCYQREQNTITAIETYIEEEVLKKLGYV